MGNYIQILVPQMPFNQKRIFYKTVFLMVSGHLFLQKYYFVFNLNTPDAISKVPVKYPISPPILQPHKYEEPERYEEYQIFWSKIKEIISKEKHAMKMKRHTHPKLENDLIITDGFFISENYRLIEEIKNEVRQKMRKINMKELPNDQPELIRKDQISKMTDKIKPIK